MNTHITFITDASSQIGFGHLVRCFNLSKELQENGFTTNFYVKNKEARLFCQQREIDINNRVFGDVIIFDLPFFTKIEKAKIQIAKMLEKKVVQITDLGLNQQEKVDLYIDQSITKKFSYSIVKKVLSGPEYAILHSNYATFHDVEKPINNEIKNVLISLGGAGKYRNYKAIVKQLEPYNFNIYIAPGFCMSRFQKWKLASEKKNVFIIGSKKMMGERASIAFYYHYVDLAIIIAGTAAFEAACCGTPALYLHYDVQAFTAKDFEKNVAGIHLGHLETAAFDVIGRLSLRQRQNMSAAGKKLVDGRGAKRVVEKIMEVLKCQQ